MLLATHLHTHKMTKVLLLDFNCKHSRQICRIEQTDFVLCVAVGLVPSNVMYTNMDPLAVSDLTHLISLSRTEPTGDLISRECRHDYSGNCSITCVALEIGHRLCHTDRCDMVFVAGNRRGQLAINP